MGEIALHFDRSGLQTLVQDSGRLGHQGAGVPIGGAMDKSSARIANWLVGNEDNSPVLEIALVGPKIRIEGDCQIAITGADMSPSIDGTGLPNYETVSVKSGTELTLGPVVNGCRTYLAIGGEWQIEPWLGSRGAASHSTELITPDSLITKGSTLKIKTSPSISPRSYDLKLRPNFKDDVTIGIIPGPEYDCFSQETIAQFLGSEYVVTPESNRMGYRLNGPQLESDSQELISSAVLPGTIQVTNFGQPIILMADAQTTGGYPRVGRVITAHQDRLAQLKAGNTIKFSLVDLDDAYQALNDQQTTLNLVLD